MVEKFQNSLNLLISQGDRILLAVSGGMDSILMCHLCHKAGIDFGIAHCNFQLRGEESDLDEVLVRELAERWNIPFFVKHFDTQLIQEQQKGSIQMLARELRYEWFEEVRLNHDFQFIATAHHLNDSLETVLYNLTKGTGVRGLSGIQKLNSVQHIIRPLSNFTRSEIQQLIHDFKINYREDASNASDKYARNKIRQHVIPVLKELNPSLEQTFLQTSQNIKETEILLDFFIQEIKGKIVLENNNLIYIDKNKLKQYPSLKTVLFELLKPYHFNNSQIDNLLGMLSGISGKELISPSHRLINDRDSVVIKKIEKNVPEEIIIHGIHRERKLGEENYWIFYPVSKDKIPGLTEIYLNHHFFDINKLKFPLTLRRRKAGDFFYPYGMKGKKKLKKYFIDKKYNIFEKEAAWILESDGNICAIIGDTIDERFKVDETTSGVLFCHKMPYSKKS